MRIRPSLALLIAVCLVTGCAQSDGAHPLNVAARDSAGIVIVENSGDASVDVIRVSDRPALQIGAFEDAPAHLLFDRIGAVSLLSTGSVAVTNTGTGEVRVFDNRGRLVGRSGGMGGGPGEYLTMSSLRRVAGDTLLVADVRAMRVTVVAPDGRYVRDFRPPANQPMGVVATLADGAAVLRLSVNVPERSTDMYHDTLGFELIRPDGATVPLGVFAHEESVISMVDFGGVQGVSKTDIPFAHVAHLAINDTLIYIGSNVSWNIHQYDGTGTLQRIIRSTHTAPQPVTRELLEGHIRAELEARGAEPTPRLIAINMQSIERLPRVSGTPVHGRMLVTATGDLWVQEYPLPVPDRTVERWTIFTGEGVLRGGVDLPLRFQPHHVAGGLVAGVYRDDFNVEYVHVYRIEPLN
jgi:hypothetical protein